VPEFLENHFRCIVFDNTGAGRSSYTQLEQNIASLSEDVLGILDALHIDKAVLVGHSMGGIIATNLAATRNDRIVASVWIGPVYPSENVAKVFEKRIKTVEREGMEAMANSIPQAAVGSKASSLVKVMIRELLLGQNLQGYISNCRVIAGAKPPDYAKVQVPVLVIAGAEDKSAPLDAVRKIYDETGTEKKKLIVLEGVGHWHCLEAPEAVGKHILDFYHEIQ
jgi:pimeloyl-ACP methyl ester carboxylesterase